MKKTNKKATIALPKKNALINAMQTNDARTLNGAVSHSTTGTSLLDLFSRGGALRNQTEGDVTKLFAAAYAEDKTLALKTLFYLGDVRGGQGERRLFRTVFNWLAQNDKVVAKKLLKYIPEYTRFDNILESLENTPLEKDALKFVAKQIKVDSTAETPTLAAKWAPSEQASSDVTRRLASKVRAELGMSPKAYRKTLSGLRAKIGIIERLMTNNEWNKIDFSAVPSRAALIYKSALAKHDKVRYEQFLTKVEKGEAKINAATLYPYDLMRGVLSKDGNDLRTVEAQWKSLPDYTEGKEGSVLVVADVSGSMGSLGHSFGDGTVSPIDVCISLALYTAERNKGPFNGYFLTFSDNSQLQKIVGGNIKEKISNLQHSAWGMSTNVQSAFESILQHGVANKVPQTEMPAKIIIVSDMQFNSCVGGTNHAAIKTKYEAAGYKLPEIVFWQVNAYGDSPVKFDEKGTMLCSGASPSILKTILSGKITSPWDMFLQTVQVERYNDIKA